MPLIKPEIQKVLRAAGLSEDEALDSQGEASSLDKKLRAAGLSLEEILEEFAHIAKNSGNESLRARCLETVLKAHGALKDTAPAIPSFTIVINGNSDLSSEGLGSKEAQL